MNWCEFDLVGPTRLVPAANDSEASTLHFGNASMQEWINRPLTSTLSQKLYFDPKQAVSAKVKASSDDDVMPFLSWKTSDIRILDNKLEIPDGEK